MLIKIILGDGQAIFRAGAARVLAEADDLRIVAHCGHSAELIEALEKHAGAVVLLSAVMAREAKVRAAIGGRRVVLMVEGASEVPRDLRERFAGLMSRHVSPAEMVECVRKVGRGENCYVAMVAAGKPKVDDAGARVRDQLTPKELQIVAMVTEGSKNVAIAKRLRTQEQVVKNSLRNIFDKVGVSDRLELALFVIHHAELRDAADAAARKLRSGG